MKTPRSRFRVSGHGKTAILTARTPGNAARLFARLFHVTLRTDRTTGWFKGLSIEAVALAMFALLAMATAARAADSLVTGPTQAVPYTILDHTLAGAWDNALWSITPAGADSRTSADGKTITWVGPPGTYQIQAIAINFATKRLAQTQIICTIGTPPPPAPPTPPTPPNPPAPPTPPSPAPTAKIPPAKFWCVAIQADSTKQTPEEVAAMLALGKAVPAPASFRWYDLNTVPASISEYTAKAQKDGLPRVLIIQDGAGLKDSQPLTDAAAITALVQKWLAPAEAVAPLRAIFDLSQPCGCSGGACWQTR